MNTATSLDAAMVPFLSWLFRTSLSAAAVAVLVLLVQLLFGRWLTPAWRYRLWGLVVLRLLLPGVPPSATSLWNAERFVPGVHAIFAAVREQSHVGSSPEPASGRWAADRSTSDLPLVKYGPIPIQPRGSGEPVPSGHNLRERGAGALPAFLAAVWLVVTAFLVARLLISAVLLSRRLRRAAPVTDADLLARLDRCCRDARVSRRPRLSVTDAVCVPAAAGLWRPAILLPPGLLARLSPDEQRAILLHELAHLHCRDIAFNWLLAVLQAVHWFNPLLWLAFGRLRADREAARDAMVLRLVGGAEPAAAADSYGRTLLKIAEWLAPWRERSGLAAGAAGLFGPAAVLVPGLFGRPGALKRRLQMITRYPQIARRRSWLGPALVVLLAAAALTRAKDPPRPAATAPAGLPVKLMMPPDPYKHQASPELQRKLDLILPQVSFDAVGLGDVLHFFGDVSGIKINVNWKALQAAGVEQSTPVTARLRNIKFSKALNVILDSVGGGQVKLEYVVRNEGLLISTHDEFAKEVQIRVYDVRDLIAPVEPRAGHNRGTGGPTAPASAPASPATRPAAWRDEQVTRLIRLIEDSVAPTSWNDHDRSTNARIGEVEGQLIVTQTGENQQAILALLRQLRESRVLRVQIESQLVRCDERTVNDLLAEWHKTVAQPPYSAAEAGIVLDDAQAKELLHACQTPGSGNSISAGPPELTLFNGQQAGMQFAPDNRSYVDGYKPTKTPDGQTRYEPVHDEVRAGFFFDVQATASSDWKQVTLSVRAKASALLRIEQMPWPFAPAGSNLQVESPQMKSAELRTTASVPAGQTLLVGGLEDLGISPGGPPAAPRARTGHRLFMLVRPTIVAPRGEIPRQTPAKAEHSVP